MSFLDSNVHCIFLLSYITLAHVSVTVDYLKVDVTSGPRLASTHPFENSKREKAGVSGRGSIQ